MLTTLQAQNQTKNLKPNQKPKAESMTTANNSKQSECPTSFDLKTKINKINDRNGNEMQIKYKGKPNQTQTQNQSRTKISTYAK